MVRGFALLGILVVNLPYFAMPVFEDPFYAERAFPGWADAAARWTVAFLAQGKFYPLFSLLFGYGSAVQLARGPRRAARRRYWRRLLGLLVLGLLHVTFLWAGDILVFYALSGALLLLWSGRPDRSVLRWGAGLILVPTLLAALVAPLLLFPEPDAPGAAAAPFAAAADEAISVFREGSYRDQIEHRWEEYALVLALYVFQAPLIVAMFLVGLWAGRRGVAGRVAELRPLLRRVLVWGLAVGVPLNLVSATLENGGEAAFLAGVLLLIPAGPAGALAYAAGLALLLERPGWRRRLAPLAPTGRLALSNYVGQSVLAGFVFYGWGLGLYARVGSAGVLAIALVIYALQVVLSGLWLRAFRFGPLEWALRSFTYWRVQPLRASQASP